MLLLSKYSSFRLELILTVYSANCSELVEENGKSAKATIDPNQIGN